MVKDDDLTKSLSKIEIIKNKHRGIEKLSKVNHLGGSSSGGGHVLAICSTLLLGWSLIAVVIGASTNLSDSSQTLIRDILLNQSTEYYDELVLEQLLVAANQTKPSPETWDAIKSLLNKQATPNSATLNQTNQIRDQEPSTARTPISLMSVNNGKNDYEENLTIINGASGRSKSAVNEFPRDFMSDQFRQKGGFLVHILIFIYLSIVLAVICDNYFLKSLEYISEALHLPADIAGATFMAIGTSAPELFTSVIGVFISDNDIGTGTIVGSAVFNLIVIPGSCGFAAYFNLKTMPKINSFPIIRDTIFYVLTIITLILCIKDNRVDWIESVTLIALYVVYIIIMYFNAQISHVIGLNKRYQKEQKHNRRNSSNSSNSTTEDESIERRQRLKALKLNIDETQPLLMSDQSVKRLSPPPAYQSKNPPFQKQQKENSKITTTNATYPQLAEYGTVKSRSSSYDGSSVDFEHYQKQQQQHLDLSCIRLALSEDGKFKEIMTSTEIEQQLKKKMIEASQKYPQDNTGKGEDLEKSIDPIEDVEADWTDNVVFQVLLFPFTVLFFFTLPKPTRFCFVMTFICSIVWIACLTYFIVWMVTLVGYTLGIPDTVSGITVLAAGTSIPELITSYLIVKKAGLADMAICNSIGSNIFDILFCLGLPWLLKSFILIVTNGFGFATLANSYIPIQSAALPITSLSLLLTIVAMIVIFNTSKWRLNLQVGLSSMTVYILFVVLSTTLELNV